MAKIYNKRANFNYAIEKDSNVETGVVLTGGEAKAVREGRGDLSKSYARILNGEMYLVNANIPIENARDFNPTRSRKLLLHKQQIAELLGKSKQRKLTIVPISLYNKGRLVKLEIALGKPKRQFEKKESIKAQDIKRDLERELKDR